MKPSLTFLLVLCLMCFFEPFALADRRSPGLNYVRQELYLDGTLLSSSDRMAILSDVNGVDLNRDWLSAEKFSRYGLYVKEAAAVTCFVCIANSMLFGMRVEGRNLLYGDNPRQHRVFNLVKDISGYSTLALYAVGVSLQSVGFIKKKKVCNHYNEIMVTPSGIGLTMYF